MTSTTLNQLLAMRVFVRVGSISKLIADLEAHLGTRLMHRTTRSVAATADGLAYHRQASRRLVELDYVTCASPGYLARRGLPETPADLAHHVRLGYFFAATTTPNPMIFERGDERIEIDTSDYATNDGNGVLAMLRAGMGIGQHFRRVVQPAIDAGELTPVLEAWRQPALPFHILYPQNRLRSARLTAFVDWLIETFRT